MSTSRRVARAVLAVAAAACALGLAQTGVAMADYDAGHYAHGNLICGVGSGGAYSIYATAPVMIPDVPNQWVAFHDELWNNSGGTWHVIQQLPWEYKHAPSDVFSDALTDEFATYSWQTSSGAWTSGAHAWTVTPGGVKWAIRQTLYWYAQSYTYYGSLDFSTDIFTQATASSTLVAPAHSHILWADQSSLGSDDTTTCSLHGGGLFY